MEEEYLYTAVWDFENPYETIDIDGFEVPVVLPKRPPNKHIKNHGKSLKNQKFRRESVPEDIKRWPEQKIERFVAKMYHKRRNGEWWKIGGRVVYITGKFWFYLNFWNIEAGGLPEFREGDLNFFLVWEHCCKDKNSYGMLDIKGRRMGDTEKSLCLMYEKASGTRKTWCGMQNQVEDDAEDNFIRIVEAHNKMIWFFKPIIPGSSDPKEELLFKYPREIYTKKKLEKGKDEIGGAQNNIIYKYEAIDGKIDYETSVKGRYDGKRLAIYHLDEPGKQKNFNVNEQWGIIKPALALKNGKQIIGKTIWTTTVEDFENAQTMENVKQTWDESNPAKKNKNNRTKSGMYRYFRNCIYAYDTDEFGFHLRDECLEFIKNERAAYEEVTDWDGLADFNRKHPITIEDVFRPPHNECILFPVFLDRRIRQIAEEVDALGKHETKKAVQGDFMWSNGFGGPVMWVPNSNGKWFVSYHPDKPNAFNRFADGLPRPANDNLFTFGVDPIDHVSEDGAGSDGGGAIFRRFNSMVDRELTRDENGDIQEWEKHRMQTDRFIADYMDRPDNPYLYFEEMLKAAIYYGVGVFPEKDRGSIIPWFESKGFKHYMKNRPKETKVEPRSAKKFKKEKGIKSNPSVINLYIQELKLHVYTRWQAYHHPRILEDFRQFSGKKKNRTKRDLTVASGMALLAAMDQKDVVQEEKKDDSWSEMPFRKRKSRV
jgi:hypothetical protein